MQNDTEDTIIDKNREAQINAHWSHIYFNIARIIDLMVHVEVENYKRKLGEHAQGNME